MIELSIKWLKINYPDAKLIEDRYQQRFVIIEGVLFQIYDYGYKEEDYNVKNL